MEAVVASSGPTRPAGSVAAPRDRSATEAAAAVAERDARIGPDSSPAPARAEAEPVAADTRPAAPPTSAPVQGSGFRTWLFGVGLMGAIAFGAWLLLQPPWKRWRWYWALRASARGLWLSLAGRLRGNAAKPSTSSRRVESAPAPVERPTIPESQSETTMRMPENKPKTADTHRYGAPLEARDNATTARRGVEVVGDANAAMPSKRKKRVTGVTLPVIPMKRDPTSKN